VGFLMYGLVRKPAPATSDSKQVSAKVSECRVGCGVFDGASHAAAAVSALKAAHASIYDWSFRLMAVKVENDDGYRSKARRNRAIAWGASLEKSLADASTLIRLSNPIVRRLAKNGA
jgi:hypothetical protein